MSNATVFRSSFKDINRKSISESNLLKNDFNDELPLNDSERAQENLANMKVRKNALEETLEKKLNELRQLCLREGELTGVLPKEFPLKENEQLPTIRRRVKTEFTFSDKLLMQPKTKEEEKLTKLELEFEIQCKIVKATSKLCNEIGTKKSIKKQRKQVYQKELAKLKDIEKNLQLTKKTIEEEQSKRMKRKNSIRYIDNESNNNELSDDENNLNKQQQFDLFNKDCLTMQSAPSTPVRCKLRNKNFINESNNQLTTNPRIDNLIRQRFNNNSPEYDTISSSSLGSANNVFLNNYCKLKNTDRKPNEFNNYEELIENSPETQAKKYFGVPTRRSAIAPNFASQDDSNILLRKQQQDLFYPSLDKYTNERLKSLTRHNSLDKFKQQETLKSLENNLRTTSIDTQRLSSTNLLSPNQLQPNQFNFSSFALSSSSSLNNNQLQMKNTINKQGSNVNMAQRPLPSPPRTVENKKLSTNQTAIVNNPKQSLNKPPPLNLNNPTDILNNKINYGSLIKTNPIRSPSTVSMFLQSPLDFEKATNLCLNKQQQKYSENDRNLIQNNNRLDQRDTIVRATPVTLTTINCSNEQFINQKNQQHSPVPILPPRTPITNKPPPITNSLNPINNFSNLAAVNLNSYQQTSNFSKNMISSNPNLNYTTGTKIMNNNKINEKKTKTWIETSIDTFKMPNNKFIQNTNCYVNHSENQLNNHHLNAMQFMREKENQFLNLNNNSSLPLRNQLNNHQFTNEDSRLSLNSNSLSSNSSSILSSNQSSSSNLHLKSSQISQPFVVEETKPYELSDFYKYSQKFKNQQKNLQQQQKDFNKESTELNNQKHYQMNKVLNNNQLDATLSDKQNDSNELMSMTMNEESFIAKNQVASEFSNELKNWLKEKYAGQNNKAATLV